MLFLFLVQSAENVYYIKAKLNAIKFWQFAALRAIVVAQGVWIPMLHVIIQQKLVWL